MAEWYVNAPTLTLYVQYLTLNLIGLRRSTRTLTLALGR
jgi:hypothetical protein